MLEWIEKEEEIFHISSLLCKTKIFFRNLETYLLLFYVKIPSCSY